MKMNLRLLVIPALVAGMHAATAADITGTVTLNGTAPESKPFDTSSVPQCGQLHTGGPIKQQFYVVGPRTS